MNVTITFPKFTMKLLPLRSGVRSTDPGKNFSQFQLDFMENVMKQFPFPRIYRYDCSFRIQREVRTAHYPRPR
jgi:hypothetical protein